MEPARQEQDFESVKARLDEIVQAVSDDNLPLDDALALYEEAVTLGLRVSDLLEEGISPFAPEDAEAEGQPEDAAAAPATDGHEGEQQPAEAPADADTPVSAE